MSNSNQNARISVIAPRGAQPRVDALEPTALRLLLPDLPLDAEYAVAVTLPSRTDQAPIPVTLAIGFPRGGIALVFDEDAQVIVTVDGHDATDGSIDVDVTVLTRLIVVWVRRPETAAMDGGILESAGPGDTPQIDAFLAADLPPVLQAGVSTVLTVRLAREELDDLPDRRDAQMPLRIRPDLPLMVKLWRDNLRVAPGTRDVLELACPAPGDVTTGEFHVVGEVPGEAVATITVRQGNNAFPHSALVLTVTVTSGPVPAGLPPSIGTAPVEQLDPRLGDLPVLAVGEDLVAGTATLTFDLSLPDGFHRTYSGLSLVDKRGYLARLYDRLEELWDLHKDAPTHDGRRRAFDTALEHYGSELADDLLPEALRDDLAARWTLLDGLAVVTTETDISWELLTVEVDSGPGPKRLFLGEKGLIRWFCGGVHPGALSPLRDRRWVLCPDDYPIGLQLPHLTSERNYLRTKLGARDIVPGSADVLGNLLFERKVDLLHFGGHGDIDSDNGLPKLLLSGFTGQLPPDAGSVYPADRLARDYPHPQDRSSPGPLVVLNACRAGRARTGTDAFAPAFLSGGAGAVLCCLWNVDDESAAEFVHMFYEALRNKETVSEALTIARTAARAMGTPAWLAYTLYAHPFATIDLTVPPEEIP
ncbi:CHAT domain-containing protein [Rhodococcus zopfii]|uniref:CHAT domain-containing protein n=1 Tax=Rhodococcus zopfii TaxID=43772 RepID=UPI0009342D90|nr:CHAT domain-containing protein [Rhodococcus zopfii]